MYESILGQFQQRRASRKETIFDYECGLLFDRGRFIKLLEPGYYNFWWTRRRSIVKIDMRSQPLVVGSQEIASLDGIPVRISLATILAVEDARKHFESAQNPQGALYVDLQVIMRELVAPRSLDQLMTERQTLGSELEDKCRVAIEKYGFRLESVSVRDITTSGEVKRAFAEVFKARKAGEAMLERARGETAALRSLANAARMMSDQPALLQLRAIQALAESAGSTLVLGTDGTVFPKPPTSTRTLAKDSTSESVE